MTAHRWMKFWPGDWKNDAALRMCGLAARGLWIELIGIMHDAEPYGHLLVNGRAPSHRQVGAIVGASERDAAKLLAELEDAGVFSRTADGVIYSRRMERDAKDSERGREAIAKRWAKKGGGEDEGGVGNSNPIEPPNRGSGSPLGSPETEADTEKKKEHPSQPSVGRSPRGSRLPAYWSPNAELRQFATALGLDPDRVAANFRDYWHAKAGKDAVKLDWPATWRGWCRREADRGPGRAGSRAPPPTKPRSPVGQWVDLMRSDAPPGFDLDGSAEEIPH